MFCDITGLSWDEAITRLKANNNDLQRAIEEHLEDPTSQKYKWDESQFSTDRHGESNDPGISFNIQGPDELPPHNYSNNAAPTRPPSRANNPSPFGAPANAAEEDANLERALAESAAQSGIQLQESGIVDNETNLTYFGPANRPDYETEQWAMIPTKATADPVKAEPNPSARKRDDEAPSFLRQTRDHRVGYLLSILHKIPLVRNVLVQCGQPAKNYGHNTEWWKGQPILKHEHLAAMARGETIWGDDAHPEFTEELHRLMAFLDQTERSYGTADGLIDTKAIDPSFGTWLPDVEERLFEALKDEVKNNPACDIGPLTSVGTILPCASPQGESPQPEGDDDNFLDDERDSPFVFLDVQLDYEQYGWVNTFYDAIDHLLWTHALTLDHTFPEDASYAVLTKAAEVLTVRLSGTGLVKPCEIPAVFYADRYLRERKELALKLQTHMRHIKKQLRLYDLLRADRIRCHGQRCHIVNGLANGPHDLFSCLKGMIRYAEELIRRQTRTAQWRHYYEGIEKDIELSLDDLLDIHTWSGPYTFLPQEEEAIKTWQAIVGDCHDKLNELEKDLAEFDDAKETYYHSMKVITKRLTCQEHEVDDDEFVFRSTPAYHPEYWNPTHKYSLRGVALTNELAYVCVRRGANSTDTEGVSEPEDQWWKIGFTSGGASPAKPEKAILEDVLHAAGTESKFPILVYASEAAMETNPLPLSDALRMFVRADNRSFQQELAKEQTEGPNQAQNQDQPSQINLTAPSGLTGENLAHIPGSEYCNRRHGNSSVATHASSRDGLSDVNLAFNEHDEFHSYQPSSGSASEYVHSDILSNNNDDSAIGVGLWSTKQQEPGLENSSWEKKPDVDHGSMEETQTLDVGTPSSKPPEMQELATGSTPFLIRPSNIASQSSIGDMMDVDLDAEHHEG